MQPAPDRRTGIRHRGVLACAALGIALLLVVPVAYRWGLRAGLHELRRSAEHQLDVYALGLQSELARYQYLPTVFTPNSDIIGLLSESADPRRARTVNRYLEAVNAQAQTAAIYVLDLKGVVRAASNWNEKVSFVGMDLSFRPYFVDALHERNGRFYGIGTTSGEPGYYFSQGIYDADRLIGVAAVKVNLDRLETTWRKASESVLVADADGVVLLSSQREWKFSTLAPLAPAVIERIRRTRQYENVSLQPLALTLEQDLGASVRIVGLREGDAVKRLLATTRPLPDVDWRITVFWDLAPTTRYARNAALIAGLGAAVLFMLLLYLWQRRQAIDELEHKVVERTADLVATNEQLQREVKERLRSERVLREAQDALVHASKMAVIGQMASGIAHELNQPLAALRTLSDNARVLLERGQRDAAERNLELIAQLIERMGRITGELKTFGRKSEVRLVAVEVGRAIGNALLVVEHRLQGERVNLHWQRSAGPIFALCDGSRLEQVLVNLLANAIDAMAGQPVRRLEIAVQERDDRVIIRVCDTGPGFAPEIAGRLFEPFFTTKASSVGLGLGLAISADIVREFGGALTAANRPDGGAAFSVELVTAREPVHG